MFVAHCVLNQNSISDGTACFPGCIPEIVDTLRAPDVGIVQMPCPELHCLGLDRGNVHGSSAPSLNKTRESAKPFCNLPPYRHWSGWPTKWWCRSPSIASTALT